MSASRARIPWLLPFLLLAFGAAALSPEPPFRIGCWLVAGIGWFLAVEASSRLGAPAGGAFERSSLALVLVGWVGLRIPMLFMDPGLSDDTQRYVWEGRLLAQGTSPYAYAPSAPELAPFRERWPGLAESVNHPEVPAAYPPAAELVFAATTSLVGLDGDARDSVRAFRVLFTACDLAVLLLLLLGLRRRRESPWKAVVWAWCPSMALEYAGSAHFDALALALLVAALVVLDAPGRARSVARAAAAGVLLGAGALVKLLPAVLMPFALRAEERARERWVALLSALAVTALVLVPLALSSGRFTGMGRGLSEYAFRWESFSLVHRWIEGLLDPHFARDEGWSDPRRLARSCAIVAWLLWAIWTWRSVRELGRAGRALVGAFLILTPTLHPWYLTWIVPFLVRQPSRAWSFLLAAAPLLYWPLDGWKADGVWREPGWLWPVVALPFLALLAWELAARARAGEPRS